MRYIMVLFVLLSVLTACSSSPQKYMGTTEEQSEKWSQTTAGIANPAAKRCFDEGFSSIIKTDDKGDQYGICVFDDGSWCDEWDYFRGDCHPGTNMTECGDQFWGKSVCNNDFIPVCAYNNQSQDWKTFNNACYACTSEGIVGYRAERCD